MYERTTAAMNDLWRYATRGRVANVMRPYIDAITA